MVASRTRLGKSPNHVSPTSRALNAAPMKKNISGIRCLLTAALAQTSSAQQAEGREHWDRRVGLPCPSPDRLRLARDHRRRGNAHTEKFFIATPASQDKRR